MDDYNEFMGVNRNDEMIGSYSAIRKHEVDQESCLLFH